jgi:hypothetical protein
MRSGQGDSGTVRRSNPASIRGRRNLNELHDIGFAGETEGKGSDKQAA